MTTKNLVFITLIALSALFTSCEKDKPDVDPGVELITTVTYTLTSGSEVVTLNFQDLDGDGGNDPVITGGTLTANTTYTGTLTLLDESKTPVENISDEVLEEDEEHQFFFDSNITGVSFAYADEDADMNPVGLASTVTTTDAGSGTITVTLRHEPAKSAEGVADGDIANAGGETDVQVTFPVDVQ